MHAQDIACRIGITFSHVPVKGAVAIAMAAKESSFRCRQIVPLANSDDHQVAVFPFVDVGRQSVGGQEQARSGLRGQFQRRIVFFQAEQSQPDRPMAQPRSPGLRGVTTAPGFGPAPPGRSRSSGPPLPCPTGGSCHGWAHRGFQPPSPLLPFASRGNGVGECCSCTLISALSQHKTAK